MYNKIDKIKDTNNEWIDEDDLNVLSTLQHYLSLEVSLNTFSLHNLNSPNEISKGSLKRKFSQSECFDNGEIDDEIGMYSIFRDSMCYSRGGRINEEERISD